MSPGSWFNNVESLAYTVVEQIPGVGTLYSFARAGIAAFEHDKVNMWQSLAKYHDGLVRDNFLVYGISEPTKVALVHSMAASFTDQLISILHSEPEKAKVNIQTKLEEEKGHVVVAESIERKKGEVYTDIFDGRDRGVHFHGSLFHGKLTHTTHAPGDGVDIHLYIPQGLYDGAKVIFWWKWATDAYGKKDSPGGTVGLIELVKDNETDTQTKFKLWKRQGAGWNDPKGWSKGDGYDFWGTILNKDCIQANSYMAGEPITIHFDRE